MLRLAFQLVVLGGQGQGDDLHILIHPDQAHALGVSAADTDILHSHTDDHTGFVDQQQIIIHGDAANAHQRTCLISQVVGGNAAAATMMLGVLGRLGQLAVAVFGNGEEVAVGILLGSANDPVAFLQADTADTGGLTGCAAVG